jgi:hypothetical protein
MAVLALIASLAIPSAGASASGEPAVDGFSPTSGAPGAAVTVLGDGFVADPEAQAVFVYDRASGVGAVVEVQAATTTRLDGVLGPSPAPFSGELEVWTGQRYSLPGGLHRGVAATYLVVRADWFVPSDTVLAPGLFEVTGGVPAAGSELLPTELTIYLGDPRPKGDINLVILICGGGDPTPPGDGCRARLARMVMRRLESRGSFSVDTLAADLAAVLQATYGAVGVRATAVGPELHLSWEGAPALTDGFAVVTFPGE